MVKSDKGKTATSLMVRDVIEQVDVIGTGNVILMDCLHHGIKTVETLDTSALVLPELGAEKIKENVLYAPLPAVASGLSREERKVVLRNHDMYIEGLVNNYFGGEDYTLIYITESRHDADNKHDAFGDHEYQMESEIPLVAHGELVKRALGTLKNSTSSSNQTIVDGPLFDKYQFFSPGKSLCPLHIVSLKRLCTQLPVCWNYTDTVLQVSSWASLSSSSY